MEHGDGSSVTLQRERCVRFRLFAHLFASGPRASSWREELHPGMATTAGHLAVLLAFVFMIPARPTAESSPETVTYLDIPPPTVASSPRAVLPPRPPVVRQGLRIPAVLAQVAQPGKLAGFQELVAPVPVSGIPPVDPAQEAVNAVDFSGRGVAGGVAGGEKPEEVPPPTDSTPLAPEGAAYAYAAAAVGEPPELLNRAELPAIMQNLYPPLLRVAGMGGRVRVEFVVNRIGRVDRKSVRTLESTHPMFSSATQTALEQFRFRPGRVAIDGEMKLVSVLVAMTIEWTLSDGGSR